MNFCPNSVDFECSWCDNARREQRLVDHIVQALELNVPVEATDACCGAATIPFELSGEEDRVLNNSIMIEPTDVTLTVLTSVHVPHKEGTNCKVGLIARLIDALAQGPGE